MQWRNDLQSYGLIAILFHWSMAVIIFEQYFLGNYMVDLDYLDPWYNRAPDLHRSFGVLAAALLVMRWGWRLVNPAPPVLGPRWEQVLALWVHRLFYGLIAGAVISGYLLSTADGHGVDVFRLFQIPAVVFGAEHQEDVAGEWHKWLANAIFFLALMHAGAALKHHFIDRDATLRRMLGLGKGKTDLISSPDAKPKGGSSL